MEPTIKVKLCLVFFLLGTMLDLHSQLNLDLTGGYGWSGHALDNPGLSGFELNSFSGRLDFTPNKIGIGLQLASTSYESNLDFLDSFSGIETTLTSTRDKWTSTFINLGPVFKFGSGKVQLDLFPKVGLGFIKTPDRSLLRTDLNGVSQMLYSDNSQSTELDGTSLFTGVEAKVDFRVTERFGIHLLGGITTNKSLGDGSSVIYRETTGTSEEQFNESSLIQFDCDAYTLWNIGLGVNFALTGEKPDRPNDDDDLTIDPPRLVYPEHESELAIGGLDSLTFEWMPEDRQVKYASYVLQLFQKGDENKADSLIFAEKRKKTTELELPEDVELRLDQNYVWRVQAVDHKKLDQCSDDCLSRTFEFKVVAFALPQFYELISSNSGNYVNSSDFLRFELSNALDLEGGMSISIRDESNDEVLLINDLSDGHELLTELGKGRYEVDIRELPVNTNYTLMARNSNRSYFLRFKKTEPTENEE